MRMGFSRPRHREMAELRAKAEQMEEWFQSAMVMVDSVPVSVAWSDPQKDFQITYVNASAKAAIAAAGGDADAIVGQRLPDLFPPLAQRRADLADPQRLPLRTDVALGPLVFDLKVIAIRNAAGTYTGAMAVWQDATRMRQLAGDFEAKIKAVVQSVAGAAREMHRTTRATADIAERTRARSIGTAAAATDTSRDVQNVATAAEGMSASIEAIARQVSQSSDAAGAAVKEAQETDKTVHSLAAVAQRIGDVVSLIQDIASQTNLLALNATIEAARAGDAGKGFAVVASEVKSLASETAKATDEIRGQIEAVQRVSAEAVRAIQSIGAKIATVSETATTIAAAVDTQGSGAQEIAQNVNRASAGTARLSADMTDVTEAFKSVGESATQMVASADTLSAQSEQLGAAVESFLSLIKTA